MIKDTWKVQIWGVRGSSPVPKKEFMEYGGNTVCVSVACSLGLFIFDAGSGLTALGNALEKGGAQKQIHIFLSHLHIDHLIGFFHFRPFYYPELEIHIYGNEPEAELKHLLGPPYWPLGIRDFSAKVIIHSLYPGESLHFPVQNSPAGPREITLRTMSGNHPGGSLLYRMEDSRKSLVYGLDCELDETFTSGYLNFAQKTDLLVWDSTFTQKDLKKGWGHSTWQQGIEFCRQAKAAQVLMLHYDSSYTDAFLSEQEILARQTDPASLFAREGMTILLPAKQPSS